MFPSASLCASLAKLLWQTLGRFTCIANSKKKIIILNFAGIQNNPTHIPGIPSILEHPFVPGGSLMLFKPKDYSFMEQMNILLFIYPLIKTSSSSSSRQWVLTASLLDLTHFGYWFLQQLSMHALRHVFVPHLSIHSTNQHSLVLCKSEVRFPCVH